MKKLILSILLTLPLWLFAQESQLNELFDKYSGQEGYTSIYITKYMFDLFKKIDTEQEDKEFQEVVSNLNSIKILTSDVSTDKFLDEILSVLPKNIYKELMIIKDGAETITFLIRDEGDKISELVMLVESDNSPLLLFMEGNINLNQLAKLSKTMDIDGLEHLDKIDKKH